MPLASTSLALPFLRLDGLPILLLNAGQPWQHSLPPVPLHSPSPGHDPTGGSGRVVAAPRGFSSCEFVVLGEGGLDWAVEATEGAV